MYSKKGSVVIYGIMLGLVLIILALALAPSIVSFSQGAMNESTESSLGLNCSNPDINNFDKASCYAVDLTSFYFVGTLILIGGAIITSKIIF